MTATTVKVSNKARQRINEIVGNLRAETGQRISIDAFLDLLAKHGQQALREIADDARVEDFPGGTGVMPLRVSKEFRTEIAKAQGRLMVVGYVNITAAQVIDYLLSQSGEDAEKELACAQKVAA